MEAELRQIIKEAVDAKSVPEQINLAEAIRRRFAKYVGVELEPHPPSPMRPPPDFSE